MSDNQSLQRATPSADRSEMPRWRLIGASLVGAALLAACAAPTRAPVVDVTPTPSTPIGGASSAETPSRTYVVRPGDTLYSIAKANNMGWQELASRNNISDPSQLRVGQALQVGGTGPAVAATTPPVQVAPVRAGAVQQRPLDGASTAGRGNQPGVNNSGIDWMWPATGQVIATFNEALNKGVDIGGNVGDPVVAAADGVVVYAGSGLRGYGNLLIVRHNPTFLSAYAHNSRLLVKENDTVKRGQTIAEMGQSDAPSPRLHFEVRRGGTPEDPLKFLPPR